MANECGTNNRNTGKSRCAYDWGLFKKTIVTPVNAVYTGLDDNNQPITFDEWIMNGIHAANPADRFYPMPNFSDSVSTTEDRTTYTNAYGQTFVIKEGNKGMTQAYNQDYCLSNRLASFNDGMSRRVIIIDSNKRAWGCEKADDSFAGYEAKIFCSSADIVQPTEVPEPTIDYSFLEPEEFVTKKTITLDVRVSEIDGLEDVEMVVTEAGANKEIRFFNDCGNADVTSEMAAISGEAECWLLNGTSTTPAPTYSGGKFTVSSTVLSSGKFTLAKPDVLFKAGLTFKECMNVVNLS